MNTNDIIEKFKDILQTDNEITCDTNLNDLEEWDSLSKMAAIAFCDKELNLQLTFKDLEEIKTINDLLKKAGV